MGGTFSRVIDRVIDKAIDEVAAYIGVSMRWQLLRKQKWFGGCEAMYVSFSENKDGLVDVKQCMLATRQK